MEIGAGHQLAPGIIVILELRLSWLPFGGDGGNVRNCSFGYADAYCLLCSEIVVSLRRKLVG